MFMENGKVENKLSEISIFQSFEYKVTWRTPIRTKWAEFLFPSTQLVKVTMALTAYDRYEQITLETSFY
jgi:hypothetical protein